MSLSEGTQLGVYEITRQIGAGGMGEVYWATDSKLGRDVAIKTLPAALASDQDRLARFEREAKLLAALHHPNIASVFSLDEHEGTLYLAMELVEGETLEEKLKAGALPVEDALRLALQIAEALEAAHDKGVVHRDLKPANVMINRDGVIKVLDFGLAKAFATDLDGASPENSPALSVAMTQAGLMLGTAGYMSPEQASGQPTDQRADIWAFGVVLYEMLTGLPLFSGESVPHILADVLRSEPDWSRLPHDLHPRLRLLLERCLEKKVRDRYHSIADVRVDIEKVLADSSGAMVFPVSHAGPATTRAVILASATLIVGALIAVTATRLFGPAPAESKVDVVRLSTSLPPGETFARGPGQTRALAVSPDGRTLAYAVGGQIWTRVLDQFEALAIGGTDGGSAPFFAPDGEWIGFFAQGQLKKVAVGGGGLPETLCDAPRGLGGSWGPDDTIYFAPYNTSGIWRVPAEGGTCEEVTTVDREQGEVSHRWPQVLPEGRGLLFSVMTGPGDDESYVDAHLFSNSERRRLVLGGTTGRWTSSGHLIYGRAGLLTAVRFNLPQLETSGTPVSLGIQVPRMEGDAYALSNSGTLAYVTGNRAEGRLVWVDRFGNREPILDAPPRRYERAAVSPDGQRAAITISGSTWDVWTYDFARPNLTLLSPTLGSSQFAVWTPDSEQIIYRGTRNGSRNLYRIAADGSSGEEERLTEGDNNQTANQVTSDGQWLVYQEINPLSGNDLWLLPLNGEHEARAMLNEPFNEDQGAISPNGNWLAYQSNRSGFMEIYVQPFPGPGARTTASGTEGGVMPRWSPDGDELFYLNGNTMMSVSFSEDPSLEIGAPMPLFEGQFDPVTYDVAPDGRFLTIQPIESRAPADRFEVVINWFEELKELAPAD